MINSKILNKDSSKKSWSDSVFPVETVMLRYFLLKVPFPDV